MVTAICPVCSHERPYSNGVVSRCGNCGDGEIGANTSSAKRRANKYNARSTVVDGVRFDSVAEARYYRILKSKEERGDIVDLELQPTYTLLDDFVDRDGNSIKGISYRADFCYRDLTTNENVVVDVKGVETPVFKIKAKLFKSNYKSLRLDIVKT